MHDYEVCQVNLLRFDLCSLLVFFLFLLLYTRIRDLSSLVILNLRHFIQNSKQKIKATYLKVSYTPQLI